MALKQCPICEGNGYPQWEEDFASKTICRECEGIGFIDQPYQHYNSYRVELTFVVPENWHIPSDVMERADELWLRQNNEAPAGADYILAYIEKQLLSNPEVRIPTISVGKYVFLTRSIQVNTETDNLF